MNDTGLEQRRTLNHEGAVILGSMVGFVSSKGPEIMCDIS